MKILIRGAGDLATGIASRLYGAGHTILMTEIETPLTVRRTVALSRAVYAGSAQVEDMKGILAEDQTASPHQPERILKSAGLSGGRQTRVGQQRNLWNVPGGLSVESRFKM